ncbi:hypothetical protein GCM10009860_04880 [Microbacterium mitrae]|uniref:Uncharacterized protein n=1 Tax=Microbacterium mitrae TaxID=664640 RepID=A0A5C8HS95_9MICO|nr:hypothetical protein [Microbacterium mitrae]TXK05881.1 hypothetical protein FVP60_02565 [Microbacterium mitrae]
MGYGELDSMIGQLKRAAIDAYMADDGFYPDLASGDAFYSKWGWAPNSYDRPDASGEGGGGVTSPNPWADSISFDGIRSRIDNAVDKWKGLPDGSGASSYKSATATAASTLGASGSGASVADDGEIMTASNTAGDLLTQNLVASFIEPMLDKYYSQFKGVAQSIGAAAAILQMNYTMQSGMWNSIREDAFTIVESAKTACAQYADSRSAASLKVTLGVVATVAAAVATVATAGTAAPLVGAMVTLSAAATTAISAIDADASVEGASYDEIVSSFEDALEALRTAINDQEAEVRKMLSGALSAIDADRGGFDLDHYRIKTSDPNFADQIVMVRQHTNVVSSNMQRVIVALEAASSTLGAPPGADPTPRDSRISSGTHSYAQSLYADTEHALRSTKDEYALGKELFDAEVQNHFNTDAANRQTVEQLAASEILTSDA